MNTLRAVGILGCRHVAASDGDVTGLLWYAIVVQEDTVITQFRVAPNPDSVGEPALADFGLTGKTLKAGAYIAVPKGQVIKAITLSSGGVIGYVDVE